MSFYDDLIAKGIDPAIAKSLAKQLEKDAARKTAPKAKRGNNGHTHTSAPAPKKAQGIHVYTALCATCGSRITKRRVAIIDPNKPLPSVVPVSICESCIPFYRTLSQDDLISLILIKDNEDITLRMLSHKEQIRLARQLSPYEVLARKFEKEIDAPYEKEETPYTPSPVEED